MPLLGWFKKLQNNNIFKINNKGFTLHELLLVITVIAIIFAIIVISIGNNYAQTRDVVRKHDLSQLKTPLEIYFLKNNRFPDPGTGPDCNITYCVSDQPDWIAGLAPTYLNPLPKDPRQAAVKTSSDLAQQFHNFLAPAVYAIPIVVATSDRYVYETAMDRSWYKVWASLETSVDSAILAACGSPPVSGPNYCIKSN